jgi:fumarate hydratase class II
MPRAFIRAVALVKSAAATANADLGLLDRGIASCDHRGVRRGRRRPP